jgi:lipoprotein-anchoring transpeptidase ErfK/SrfK
MYKINRRDFIKLSTLGFGIMAVRKDLLPLRQVTEWPQNTLLGRNCTRGIVPLRSRPSVNSDVLQKYYEDTVVVWLREVVGEAPSAGMSRRWVETPDGYVYAPSYQPVYYRPNTPVQSIPQTSLGPGMWVQVTVPYVQLQLENKNPISPWLTHTDPAFWRLYYSQIIWVDQMRTAYDGTIQYRVNERYGPGDKFWADAGAFQPLTDNDFDPISASVADTDKQIVVNKQYQSLTCYEGAKEVYFCRVSTGRKFDMLTGEPYDEPLTPEGEFHIFRKLASMHMIGGAVESGWDTPGIGWTCLFAPGGVAIHSTFWHNNYGVPVSHGCVNVTPQDAHWIFRWTTPIVPMDPGDVDITVEGALPGTRIKVLKG